jgi:hypothetical protein
MGFRGLNSSFQRAYRLIRLSKGVIGTKKATAQAMAFLSGFALFPV